MFSKKYRFSQKIYDNVYEYRITDKNGFRFYISRVAQLCHGYMGGIDYKDIQSIKRSSKNIIAKLYLSIPHF